MILAARCLFEQANLKEMTPVIAQTISCRFSSLSDSAISCVSSIQSLLKVYIALNIQKYNQTPQPTRLLEIYTGRRCCPDNALLQDTQKNAGTVCTGCQTVFVQTLGRRASSIRLEMVQLASVMAGGRSKALEASWPAAEACATSIRVVEHYIYIYICGFLRIRTRSTRYTARLTI